MVGVSETFGYFTQHPSPIVRKIIENIVPHGDRFHIGQIPMFLNNTDKRKEVVAIGLKGRVSKAELLRLFEGCAAANEPTRSNGLVARVTSWLRTRPSPDVAS